MRDEVSIPDFVEEGGRVVRHFKDCSLCLRVLQLTAVNKEVPSVSIVTVTLSPELAAELEPLAAETHATIESIVNTAVAEYLRLREKGRSREQLAEQYDELAAMRKELVGDLADGKWLHVENEALLQFAKTLAD